MMRILGAAFATISQRIRELDPDTHMRMRLSHRPIIKAKLNDVGRLKHADAHKKWCGKRCDVVCANWGAGQHAGGVDINRSRNCISLRPGRRR
jgi:hypothetical protein